MFCWRRIVKLKIFKHTDLACGSRYWLSNWHLSILKGIIILACWSWCYVGWSYRWRLIPSFALPCCSRYYTDTYLPIARFVANRLPVEAGVMLDTHTTNSPLKQRTLGLSSPCLPFVKINIGGAICCSRYYLKSSTWISNQADILTTCSSRYYERYSHPTIINNLI